MENLKYQPKSPKDKVLLKFPKSGSKSKISWKWDKNILKNGINYPKSGTKRSFKWDKKILKIGKIIPKMGQKWSHKWDKNYLKMGQMILKMGWGLQRLESYCIPEHKNSCFILKIPDFFWNIYFKPWKNLFQISIHLSLPHPWEKHNKNYLKMR